jgi:hypothetical protein
MFHKTKLLLSKKYMEKCIREEKLRRWVNSQEQRMLKATEE